MVSQQNNESYYLYTTYKTSHCHSSNKLIIIIVPCQVLRDFQLFSFSCSQRCCSINMQTNASVFLVVKNKSCFRFEGETLLRSNASVITSIEQQLVQSILHKTEYCKVLRIWSPHTQVWVWDRSSFLQPEANKLFFLLPIIDILLFILPLILVIRSEVGYSKKFQSKKKSVNYCY